MAKNTYDRIIKISTKLMSMYGFYGTSLQMISEKVGISKSTIVHHFTSKEGLLIAILNENLPLTINNLTPIVNDEHVNGTEKLNRFIHYHLNQLEKRWDIMNLFLMQSKFLDNYSRTKFAKMQCDYWKLVEQIVIQIQKEKSGFEKLDPKIVSIGIIGMLTWVGLWYRKNGKHSITSIAETFYRIITNPVINTQVSEHIDEIYKF